MHRLIFGLVGAVHCLVLSHRALECSGQKALRGNAEVVVCSNAEVVVIAMHRSRFGNAQVKVL